MKVSEKNISRKILSDWKSNTTQTEWTFHQLSPYIGKLKSSVAISLLKHFTKEGDTIYDPFCGAGTVPLESWALNRVTIANDLNIYAYTLSHAKLNPPRSLEKVLGKLIFYNKKVQKTKNKIDLRTTPKWVRAFFHNETLRETIAWCKILIKNDEYFILACLMGILHHQRPGFLSFPSSHSVPYLRINKFPKNEFPELYTYRNVFERLKRKIERSFKRLPDLNYKIKRLCYSKDASTFIPPIKANVIISSPPYMRQLDYARDNRLRLWFLGVNDFKKLDSLISPTEVDFLNTMKKCLTTWNKSLIKGGRCILVLGDSYSKLYKLKLPDTIIKIATCELKNYSLELKFQSIIPEKRRVRKLHKGSERETVIVLKKIN